MPLDLDRDPRWVRLHAGDWVCGCCGDRHDGVFDLGSDRPAYWPRGAGSGSEGRAGDNYLNEDFCVVAGRRFFVRCVLYLPIIGASGASFGLGVWSALSKPNFDLYVDTFEDDRQGELGPWFGSFANRLEGYPETLDLRCRVLPQDGGQRPHIEVELAPHPLAIEQRKGITFDRLLDIYAANGHDLRPALSN